MTDQLKDALLKSSSEDKWKKLGVLRRAGILVPLASVYSENSTGIADFYDVKLLVDLCEKTGSSILQFLPMNEVGPLYCPYDSISSFALEPMYLSLKSIPYSKTGNLPEKIVQLSKRFPRGSRNVDYRIKSEKLILLRQMFDEKFTKVTKELERFIDINSYWLEDFALFYVLKSYQQQKAWFDWEEKYRERDKVALAKFFLEHEKELIFYKWVQWLAFKQFKEAKDYARERGVLLKGDLPILVSRDSADVWAHREYFRMDFVAGAPPDMYCSKGQRWGTPTYNWEKIFSDKGNYVKEKLRYAENFYDILRIDHVVGLFRIWSIPYNDPLENMGLNGAFVPAEEAKWEEHGKRILSLILHNTKMLLCAEDLGVVPKACVKTLKEYGIPGNDVQRWTKEWEKRNDFLMPQEYRELSVTMLSTHDTTNWPAWWENEAGTIDEGLFERKCNDRKIDFAYVKQKLFDPLMSKHGRLRWLDEIDSVDKLLGILGKRKEEALDFIDLYVNSYHEKEKLWTILKLDGKMSEKSDPQLVRSILQFTLDSNSIFCNHLIIDYLYLADILKGDPYDYRYNTPGTVSEKNWSLVMPIALEELLKHPISDEIGSLVEKSARLSESVKQEVK